MYPKLQDLPEECIREIILRINDHRDLESSSAAWTLMAALASEQRVWRELTQFHFTKQQIDQMIQKQFSGTNSGSSDGSVGSNDDANTTNNMSSSSSSSSNSEQSSSAAAAPAAQSATDSSKKSNDINRNGVNRSENKPSKRFSNTKDWQKIYHALRR